LRHFPRPPFLLSASVFQGSPRIRRRGSVKSTSPTPRASRFRGPVLLLKWQVLERFFLTGEASGFVNLRLGDVLYLGAVVAVGAEVVDFLAALATDVGELLLALDAEVAAAYQVGGDAGGLLVVGLNGVAGLNGRLRIVP